MKDWGWWGKEMHQHTNVPVVCLEEPEMLMGGSDEEEEEEEEEDDDDDDDDDAEADVENKLQTL